MVCQARPYGVPRALPGARTAPGPVVELVSRLDTGLPLVRTLLTARLAPLLLLLFAVVWPLAGFPWWPLALVVVLAVVGRVLGFGYLLAGRRGPVLLIAPCCWSPRSGPGRRGPR